MLPADLKSKKRWVNWRWAGHSKIPLQHCDKPETWLDYETALSRCVKSEDKAKMVGLGIQLGDGLIGIDLDWKHWETTKPWETIPDYARQIIDEQRSYTEWSPSGRGCHIYAESSSFTGTLKTQNVEIYSGNRFFTVTGRGIGDPVERLNGFCEDTFRRHEHESRVDGDSGRERSPGLPRDYAGAKGLVPEGLRNDDLRAYSCKLVAKGEVKNVDELIAQLRLRAEHHHVKGDPEDPKIPSLAQRTFQKFQKDGTFEEWDDTSLEDHTDVKVNWLIDHRVVEGRLTIFAGDPGIGKSTAVHEYAARLTKDGQPVAVVTREEEPGMLKDRHKLFGGNCRLFKRFRVHNFDSDDPEENNFNFCQHYSLVYEWLIKTKPKMLIIDPLPEFLGIENWDKDAGVRPAVQQIHLLARRTGTAIVGLIHLNKTQTTSAIDKVAHARAFTSVARNVWVFEKDPDGEDDTFRIMSSAKGTGPIAQKYQMKVELSPIGNEIPLLTWGEEVKTSADEILVMRKDAPMGEKRKAIVERIRDLVENLGVHLAGEVQTIVARDFKVSKDYVSRLAKNLDWLKRTGHGKHAQWHSADEKRAPEYITGDLPL